MAINEVMPGNHIPVPGLTKNSGDWVRLGGLNGTAEGDTDTNGITVLDVEGIYEHSVTAADTAGDSAIAWGDNIFDDGDDTLSKAPALDGNNNITNLFGIACGTLAAGETGLVPIKPIPATFAG